MNKVLTSAFVLALMTAPACAQDYPELNLRFASYVSADLPQSQVDQWWAEEINRRSGGKVSIDFFWSQTLGKSTELLQLTGAGAVDFGATSIGYYTSDFLLANVSQLPMLLPDNRIAQRVAENVAEIPAVAAEFEATGVVPLIWHSLPTYHVLCNRKVAKVADFEGARLRSYGEYVPRMWNALDATGVTVLAPEMYEGLQRGNVDCIYISADFANAYKLQEVAEYFNEVNFGAISAWTTFVNADKWASWPQEVRDLITEVSAEAAEREREAVFKASEDAKAAMRESGMTFVAFEEDAKLRETVPDFLQVWSDQMTERGLGEAAAEVAEVVRATISPE